jgi:hypothetical protein
LRPEITVTEGGELETVRNGLKNLSNMRAYVGIPEANNSRPGQVIGNAALLYIQTNGANLPNGAVIPPRPVIEPSIEANRKIIEDELEQCIDAEIEGKIDEAITHLKKAGTLGANGAKRWFRDPRNGWAPNAPSTIRKKGSDLRQGKAA